jgi:hypothetical protein
MPDQPQPPGAGELTYTRVFDAPRELVFRCMVEPEHLTHFWGPAGVHTPLDGIKVDARPGGVFETAMVNDADVTPTSTFTDLGGARTEVRIHQANVPPAFLSPEAQAGFATSLDRFAGYLGQISRRQR